MDENNEQPNMQDEILRDDLKKGADKVKQKKQETENNFGNQAIQQGAKQVRGAIKNVAQKKIAPAVKKIAGKVAKFLAPLITCVIILLVCIGLISFILNMPGLIRGKIEAVFQSIILEIKGDNSKLDPESITKEKRLELLNTLSGDLGFDVIGFGFVPIARYETGEDSTGKQKIVDYDTEMGWAYFVDGKEATEETKNEESEDHDLLYYYLMANERSYVQNDDGLFGFFRKNKWTGMLNVYDENFVSDSDIEVKREEKLLEIRNANPHWGEMLNKDVFTFSLDGWTGRYGKPLEFTLALHLATMSSGMTKELITNENLQTQVYIALHKADCDINFTFTKDTGEPINIPFNPKGNVEDLTEKIKKAESGATIEDEDLSIRGIVYASKQNWGRAELDEYALDDQGYLRGISRHIDTIDAVLSNNDMAIIENTANQLTTCDLSYNSIYGFRELYDLPYELSALGTEYNPACGSFICSFDGNEPNVKTGMLGTIYSCDAEGVNGRHLYGDIYFAPTETDDHIYRLIFHGKDLDDNIVDTDLGVQVLIPRPGNVDCNDDNMYVLRVKGLTDLYTKAKNPDGHLNIEDNINFQRYASVFDEIDWFLGTLVLKGNGTYAFNYYTPDENIFSNYESLEYYYYYKNLYKEVMNNWYSDEDYAKAAIITLYEQLEDDYSTVKANAQITTNGEEIINKILQNKATGLTVDILRKVVISFGGNPDADNDEGVEFSQPRITKVIKHWYKDIDFERINDDYPSAYVKTNESITIKYTGDDIEGFSINAVLTPREGEYLYKQRDENGDRQPRVVKGETVFLDGEVIGSTDELYGDEEPVEGYCWGDGYRTTKKIFTQGYYYSFDGSAETSKSVYWQQQLEDTETPTTFTVSVANGRVCYISPNPLEAGGEHVSEHEVNASDYSWPSGVSVQYLSERKGLSAGYYQDLQEDTVVRFYHLTVSNTDAVKYLSPTEHTYEEVTQRANEINDMWKAMGVYVLRRPLSFDNTAEMKNVKENGDVIANDEVMANIGLSILKNCDTKDADYIYRDLKEMLLDLGYYTQAEFDQLDSAVLTWFMPGYTPAVFPENSPENFNFAAIMYPYEGEDADDPLEEKDTTHHAANGAKEVTAADWDEFLKNSEENMGADAFTKYMEEKTKADEEARKAAEEKEKTDGDSLKDSLIVENVTSDKDQTDVEKELDISEKLARGFKAGLSVVAPGDCTVISYDASAKQLEIEFDGISEPKISMLDGYKMIITGVEFDSSVVTEGNTIKDGTEIGKTGKDPITVMLLNDIDRVLSNVEDYMCPPRINGESQPYEFTMEEVILLAYIIDHEAAPEGLTGYMKESEDSVYETKEDAALAYAEAVGYVLINRALTNYGDHGTTIEEQSMAPGQYDGSFSIEHATSHQYHISAKSMEAALFCATYDCDAITNEEGETMSREVTGESAWVFGHQIFWWLDVDHNGNMDMYAESMGKATAENPYPVEQGKGHGNPALKEWPWDGYLTYSY